MGVKDASFVVRQTALQQTPCRDSFSTDSMHNTTIQNNVIFFAAWRPSKEWAGELCYDRPPRKFVIGCLLGWDKPS